MKAEMNEFGVITLTPETSVESYAMKRWCDNAYVIIDDEKRKENGCWRGSRLILDTNLPDDES